MNNRLKDVLFINYNERRDLKWMIVISLSVFLIYNN
nr:MAG TPA: hypothetical protein [Caudoviricetes sp.]